MATNRTHNKNKGVRRAHEQRRHVLVLKDRAKQKARQTKDTGAWQALDGLNRAAKAEGRS